MKMSQQFKDAFKEALQSLSVYNMAEKAKIHHSTIYNMINNDTDFITQKNYDKLLPVLQPFLDKQEVNKKIDTVDLTELDRVIISKLVTLNDSQKADILKQIIEMLKSDNDGK